MLIPILTALLVPVITGLIIITQKKVRNIHCIALSGSTLTSASLLAILYYIIVDGEFSNGMFYLDYLSAIMIIVVAILTFTATLFSVPYMKKELADRHIVPEMLPRYYALLNIFTFTIISVLVAENLGIIWVAVEATTLASALLVAFYFNRPAIEAAWKYVMVCTVGICLALLGTIILYYAEVNAVGMGSQALSWLLLREISHRLDPALVKLAFVFIVIGYGTKIGLAPMHTWLPDAHSQAPSPVSGLLSGALLSCALYALVRNLIVIQGAIGVQFVQMVLVCFGFFSILIAIPFILVQHDVKRLLAYSSVEHMGIITFGLGIGTPLAVYGALLHVINHAVAKSALFYLAGIITQEYGTKNIMRIRGIVTAMPVIGTLFILTILVITGMPPFSIFMSKLTIAWAAFVNGRIVIGSLFLFLLTGIFAGMVYYCIQMSFSSNKRHKTKTNFYSGFSLSSIYISVGMAVVLGVYLPSWLHYLLIKATNVVLGS